MRGHMAGAHVIPTMGRESYAGASHFDSAGLGCPGEQLGDEEARRLALGVRHSRERRGFAADYEPAGFAVCWNPHGGQFLVHSGGIDLRSVRVRRKLVVRSIHPDTDLRWSLWGGYGNFGSRTWRDHHQLGEGQAEVLEHIWPDFLHARQLRIRVDAASGQFRQRGGIVHGFPIRVCVVEAAAIRVQGYSAPLAIGGLHPQPRGCRLASGENVQKIPESPLNSRLHPRLRSDCCRHCGALPRHRCELKLLMVPLCELRPQPQVVMPWHLQKSLKPNLEFPFLIFTALDQTGGIKRLPIPLAKPCRPPPLNTLSSPHQRLWITIVLLWQINRYLVSSRRLIFWEYRL